MTTDPLDQTRRLLAQIPGLWAELPTTRYMARLRDDEPVRKPLPGSRPPLDITLLDLASFADIQWWVNEAIAQMVAADREPDTIPSSRTPNITEQCDWLAEHADWIAHENPDFCGEIKSLHWMYRRATGHLPQVRLSCLQCGNRAFIDGQWLICSEVERHARTIKDIEHEHRFRPKETTQQICDRFGITEDRIYQWRQRRKLTPADRQGRTLYWWPWDVFCLLHRDVADAINTRDEHSTKEPA